MNGSPPPTAPSRTYQSPYTFGELGKLAQSPEPRIRRPAKMSLWLRGQPEPPRDTSTSSLNMLASLGRTGRKSITSCDEKIAKHEAIKATLPPTSSEYAQIDTLIEDLKYERNYMWWRTFRINNLPVEIFTNIIRYVVWSTSDLNEGVMYRWHLTWVCRRWRQLAITDQTLWSVVWMRDRAPYVRSQIWLDRAGSTTPLDIRISERENEPSFNTKSMERLLNVLFPKLSQIRILVVVIDTWEPALVLLRKLQRAGMMRIPIRMERFELHRAGRPYEWAGPGYDATLAKNPFVFCGGKASQLNYLAINGVYIDWARSPLSNLTTLDLRRMALDVSPTLECFRDILKGCPNLHKLALDGAGPKVEMAKAARLKPVELPSVRHFVMGDFSLQYALYVLSQISLPNTRDLTMMNMTGEDYSPLITAMTGSFKDVRLLTLYTIDVAETSMEILVNWLRSMPLVRYLRIAQVKRHICDAFLEDPTCIRLNPSIFSDDASSDDSFSSASSTSTSSTCTTCTTPTTPCASATTSSEREVLCPKLHFLEFQSVDSSTIIAFGEGRKALQLPLRKIYVNRPWVQRLEKPDVEALMSLSDLLVVSGAPTPEESSVVLGD